MILPFLSQEEFLSYLKDHGCKVASTEHWDEFDMLIMEKDGYTFSFTLEKRYVLPFVVRKCLSLDIDPPPDFLHEYYRNFKPGNTPCYCKSGVAFQDCHGKAPAEGFGDATKPGTWPELDA
jgi:hypothetical protein